jgi:outer membrane protein OmpA-like peptidoglycan-associated protein
MLRKTTIVLSLLYFALPLNSQSVTFELFEGTSFHIPYNNYKLGYGKHVESYDTLSSFRWKEINVSERNTDVAFPDVPKTTGFGVVFKSRVLIDSSACYEFVLNSDDGSLLFIQDSLLIDNGGNHQMRARKDTFLMKEGSYDMLIWYQQLYPTKYGFIFDAAFTGSDSTCTKTIEKEAKRLVLQERLNFKNGSFSIDGNGKTFLDSIISEISTYRPTQILIAGHTDDVGKYDDNMKLSLNRANTVMKYLDENLHLDGVEIKTEGYADTQPLEEGSSRTARAKNRRVEIILQ